MTEQRINPRRNQDHCLRCESNAKYACEDYMRRCLPQLCLPFLGVGALLLGLAAIGHATSVQVRNHEPGDFLFIDIDCVPPPGLTRTDFLDEVQYLANLPTHLNVLDEHLALRLAHACSLHPHVRDVECVQVRSPRHILVRLHYRNPDVGLARR